MKARRTSTGILLLVASALPAFAIATAILGITRIILIAIGALIHSWNDRSPRASPRFSGKVAVIVPAYNEEKVICATIEGLLSSTVRDSLEIIVVDDGSTDATSVVLKNCFGDTAQLIVYRKQNGGKASALNFGIQRTEADIIVAIDGDTILLPDAIERLAAHFVDPTVGAVAGTVSVGNVESLLTRFQALEYITSQNMDRRAFALLNAIGVVPGAIGAWRRQALNEVGGYSTVTLAEDADLTIEVERRGWRVVVEPRAVALTEAPEHLRAFLKQRFRWTFGTLQVAYKHASTFWRLPINVSLITIPNILVFQIAFSLLAPVFDTLLLYTSALLVIGVETGKTLHILVSYWLFFQIIDVTSAFIGVAISGDRSAWRLLPLVLLQRFSYRYLLCIVTVRAVLAAVKGRIVGWGKLIRTGAVTHSLARGLHS
jgi:cellulose synthase/poly-beta-1,6-N-acetylglucosamine synthase-like glycosyltransferase